LSAKPLCASTTLFSVSCEKEKEPGDETPPGPLKKFDSA
jgi:hypothetical protein